MSLITRALAGRVLRPAALAAAAPTAVAATRTGTPLTAKTVLAHPEAVSPFDYATAVQWLWARGRRQQAAFWFYVFQARTRP